MKSLQLLLGSGLEREQPRSGFQVVVVVVVFMLLLIISFLHFFISSNVCLCLSVGLSTLSFKLAHANCLTRSMPELDQASAMPAVPPEEGGVLLTPDDDDVMRYNVNHTPRTRSDLTMDKKKKNINLYKIFTQGRQETEEEDDW